MCSRFTPRDNCSMSSLLKLHFWISNDLVYTSLILSRNMVLLCGPYHLRHYCPTPHKPHNLLRPLLVTYHALLAGAAGIEHLLAAFGIICFLLWGHLTFILLLSAHIFSTDLCGWIRCFETIFSPLSSLTQHTSQILCTSVPFTLPLPLVFWTARFQFLFGSGRSLLLESSYTWLSTWDLFWLSF